MLTRVLPIGIGIAMAGGYQLYREFSAGTPVQRPKTSASVLVLSADDTALSAKLEPFIACINRTDANLLKAYQLYRVHVQAVQTPAKTGAQLMFVGDTFRNFKVEVYEQDNAMSKACADGLEKASRLAPLDATLDRIAPAYASTIRNLIPLMNEADLYYGQKDHIDDRMAKGRKLDAQIAPLFDTLAKLSVEIRSAVSVHDARLQDVRLLALEKQRGKTLDWHTLNVFVEARRAVASLDGATPSKPAVTSAEQRLQAAFDSARTASDAVPAPQPNAPKSPWSRMQSDAAAVLLALKDLRRDLDAGKPQNEMTNATNRVIGRYNTLVRNHNMMRNI
jgi:Protein of unknown function (DUF3829)